MQYFCSEMSGNSDDLGLSGYLPARFLSFNCIQLKHFVEFVV